MAIENSLSFRESGQTRSKNLQDFSFPRELSNSQWEIGSALIMEIHAKEQSSRSGKVPISILALTALNYST